MVRSIRIRRLRPARAAVGVGRRRRRERPDDLERVGLDVVRPAVDPAAQDRRAGRDELEVGAQPDDELGADAADLAVLVRRVLHLLPLVAAVDRGEVALRALLRPLHRPADPLRQSERERLLGVDVELRAEAAADVRRDHPQARLGHAEDDREPEAQDVRDLGRRPERVLVGRGLVGRDHAARLDRVRDQALLAVALLHGHGRVAEDALDVAALELPGEAVVRAEVVVEDRRAVGERLLGVDHGRKLLVVDLDELGRVLRQSARLGDHDRDAVALVAHLVGGERAVHRLLGVLGDEPDARERGRPVVGEVGAGERPRRRPRPRGPR